MKKLNGGITNCFVNKNAQALFPTLFGMENYKVEQGLNDETEKITKEEIPEKNKYSRT